MKLMRKPNTKYLNPFNLFLKSKAKRQITQPSSTHKRWTKYLLACIIRFYKRVHQRRMTGNAIVLPLAVKWRHLLKDKRRKWCEKMFHITYDKQQCFRKLTMILLPVMKTLLDLKSFLVKIHLIVICDKNIEFCDLLLF